MRTPISGIIITWQAKNTRKSHRIEKWCADYGLTTIYKSLYAGPISDKERRELEWKTQGLLTGKRDRYCIVPLCASCLKGFHHEHEIGDFSIEYEIIRVNENG